jgi:hypothetical protein
MDNSLIEGSKKICNKFHDDDDEQQQRFTYSCKLSNKIQQLIDKMGSIDVKSWNIRGDHFQNLGENLYVIKRVVLCAEKFERKHGIYTYAVQVWLKKLKDALDDVVHLLDQFSTQDLKKKNSRNLQIFFSSSNHLVFSFNMSTKIKDLAKRTASLKIFCESYPHPCVQTPHSTIVKTRFFFTNPPPQFFAREKEKKDLMDFQCERQCFSYFHHRRRRNR